MGCRYWVEAAASGAVGWYELHPRVILALGFHHQGGLVWVKQNVEGWRVFVWMSPKQAVERVFGLTATTTRGLWFLRGSSPSACQSPFCHSLLCYGAVVGRPGVCPPPATPTAAGHHVAAAEKLFRRSFPVNSKNAPREPIYPTHYFTLLHAPPSPPPTSAAAAMPPYITSTTPCTITPLPSSSSHRHHRHHSRHRPPPRGASGLIMAPRTSMGIEGYLRCVFDSESWITCDNTNGNTTLSKVQGVSLRITSGVRRNRLEQGLAHKSVILEVFHDLRGDCRVVYHDLCLGRPTAKGVGLRVESSHTGNHREDDFTPLETIRRFLGIIGSKSLSSSNGRPLSWRGGVLLPKRSQTILDVPLGFVGLYTHHLTLSNLRLPIPEFIYEVLNYLKVHIFRLNPFGMVKLTTFVVMCKAYGGEPNLDMLRAFLNLGHVSNWLALSNRGGADIPKALTKPMTHIKG
ncbi:hypothetical protein Tco_0294359 [Tanacetum coccineum]